MTPSTLALLSHGARSFRQLARPRFQSMDHIALIVSTRAEIFSILNRLKPDTRRGAEILLDGLGISEDDYDAPLSEWADEQYANLDASTREDAGYRYWSDEVRGCRLERAYA